MHVPMLALAGLPWPRRRSWPESAGTFPGDGRRCFVVLLVSVILHRQRPPRSFPGAITRAPIVEHFLMQAGRLF